MTKKQLTAAAAGLALLGGGAWVYRHADAKETPVYRFAAVERGSLQSAVSATGALSAVRTVQVGTQVSGQISGIYVDFNDRVRKGQLLARIDPTLQQQAVQDAQAGLERAQAQLSLAQSEYARNKQLFDAKIVTASEFGTVQSNFSVQQANVKSARIALERAQKNLRSEEHTSELQSRQYLVCRLLLEKKISIYILLSSFASNTSFLMLGTSCRLIQ